MVSPARRTLPPRRTNLGSYSSRRQILQCRSYTHSPARCSSTSANSPTRTSIAPIIGPQCRAKHPLTAHGFYTRTIVDAAFDGLIRVRRYLCETCRRTVSLLPQFALPYLRSSVAVIACSSSPDCSRRKLSPTRCRHRRLTSAASSGCAASARKPRPWCAALAALTKPAPAPNFVSSRARHARIVRWISAHRFLFAGVRQHLLGWPRSLVPDGRRAALAPAAANA